MTCPYRVLRGCDYSAAQLLCLLFHQFCLLRIIIFSLSLSVFGSLAWIQTSACDLDYVLRIPLWYLSPSDLSYDSELAQPPTFCLLLYRIGLSDLH